MRLSRKRTPVKMARRDSGWRAPSAILSRFYNLVAAEVRRFGGTVEKYLGDAALAIFGLPDVHEDDAERAVRAALAARDALAELNARLAAEGRSRLTMRIAVNTGEVVADPKGGVQR